MNIVQFFLNSKRSATTAGSLLAALGGHDVVREEVTGIRHVHYAGTSSPDVGGCIEDVNEADIGVGKTVMSLICGNEPADLSFVVNGGFEDYFVKRDSGEGKVDILTFYEGLRPTCASGVWDILG